VSHYRAVRTPAVPSSFAAPWAIIAHGPLLAERVVIADWNENQRIVSAFSTSTRDVPARSMAGRAYVDLAMYWGPEWKHLEHAPEKAKLLRIDQASQRSRLYLPQGDQSAAIVYNPPDGALFSATLATREVSDKGLAVLATHGVPIAAPTSIRR
jgi:hypothetical protein